MSQWLCGYYLTVTFRSHVLITNTPHFGLVWPSFGISYVISHLTIVVQSLKCDYNELKFV
jgi:hypothetical protein